MRRLARDQLLGAIDELNAPLADRPDAVHEARLRLKKVRALLRLVRLAAPDAYKQENAALRDIARTLSFERDRQATIEALDKLLDHAERKWAERKRAERKWAERKWAEREWGEPGGHLHDLRQLRSRLVEAQQHESNDAGREQFVDRVHGLLRESLERLEPWTAAASSDDVVADGFAESYRRGRRALHLARANPTAENLHEWRKQIKYHRYQVRLFHDAWPVLLDAHYQELKRLSDLLGDDHDLVLLGEAVGDGRALAVSQDAVCQLTRLIERRRGELRAGAFPLGRLLFAEKPKQLTRRFTRYWCAHRQADH